MSESLEIANTFTEQEPYMPQYSKESWGYIPDYNNQSYQNQIMFNSRDVKAKKILWSHAYLSIPLLIQADPTANPAAPYTNATKVALKNSVLSLIEGLQINNIGGGTVVNESNLMFINNLRLILDTDSDFMRTKAAEIQFGIDNNVWNPSTPNAKAVSVAGTTPGTNQGFFNRITFLQNLGFQNGAFSFTAYIPLKYLHPIFASADFVMYGSNFELFIRPSFLGGAQYPPLLADTSGGGTVLPVVSINPALTPCRLYYKAVELEPSEDEKFMKRLMSGIRIKRDYLASELYPSLLGLQNVNTNLNNYQITNSITNPTAMYVLLFPPNAIRGPSRSVGTVPNTLITTTLPQSPVGTLSNVQIYLNDVNVFPDTQLITPLDFWKLLQERLVGSESEVMSPSISYSDFLSCQRIHYFDLSKPARMFENLPVAVKLTATRGYNQDGTPDTTLCDYVVLFEKKYSVAFDMSNGICQLEAGQSLQ